MIEEPQLTYLLELLDALGENADHFILVGARAMNFNVKEGRRTKDFDFVLQVQILRNSNVDISPVLKSLGYNVVETAKYFQFDKKIPGSNESIRIEFLAPGDEKDGDNFRVKIQPEFHAHACTGAEIVYNESSRIEIEGVLPNGNPLRKYIRVAQIWAILMLKTIALDDRYKNIRGVGHVDYDRDEARIFSSDVILIIHDHIQNANFTDKFWRQLNNKTSLKDRIVEILNTYYGDIAAPGIQLYREFIRMQKGENLDEDEERRTVREVEYLLACSN
jgi:hypothetical protein